MKEIKNSFDMLQNCSILIEEFQNKNLDKVITCLNRKITFGKHNTKNFFYVVNEDLSYLKWLIDKDSVRNNITGESNIILDKFKQHYYLIQKILRK